MPAPKQYQPWHRGQRKRPVRTPSEHPRYRFLSRHCLQQQQSRAIHGPLGFYPTNKDLIAFSHLLRAELQHKHKRERTRLMNQFNSTYITGRRRHLDQLSVPSLVNEVRINAAGCRKGPGKQSSAPWGFRSQFGASQHQPAASRFKDMESPPSMASTVDLCCQGCA